MAKLAILFPNRPGRPKYKLLFEGIMSLAFQVVKKGIKDGLKSSTDINGRKFNWRAARKWGVTVYGGSQNSQSSWGGLRENYDGKAGNFTSYNNYKGETWTEEY